MKISRIALLATILTIFTANCANAQSILDALKGLGNTTSTSKSSAKGSGVIGNLIEGIFNSSNITVADMTGTWDSTGPAVCFQGEGFLKKAGGVAAAAAIESKLAPYYEQYGLNNAVLTIDKEGNFTLKMKMLTLKGNITEAPGAEKGVFLFNFTALGSMRLGSLTTYVQKTSGSMDVMFDATKLKSFISTVAKLSGMKMAKTLSALLDQYEGLCVGFHLSKDKNATTTDSSSQGSGLLDILGIGASTQTETDTDTKTGQTQGATQSGSILDIFGIGSQSETQPNNTTNTKNTNNSVNTGNTENTTNTGLDKLREAIQKKKKK